MDTPPPPRPCCYMGRKYETPIFPFTPNALHHKIHTMTLARHYKVITNTVLPYLEFEVNKSIAQGWRVQGGIAIVHDPGSRYGGSTTYMQSMVMGNPLEGSAGEFFYDEFEEESLERDLKFQRENE